MLKIFVASLLFALVLGQNATPSPLSKVSESCSSDLASFCSKVEMPLMKTLCLLENFPNLSEVCSDAIITNIPCGRELADACHGKASFGTCLLVQIRNESMTQACRSEYQNWHIAATVELIAPVPKKPIHSEKEPVESSNVDEETSAFDDEIGAIDLEDPLTIVILGLVVVFLMLCGCLFLVCCIGCFRDPERARKMCRRAVALPTTVQDVRAPARAAAAVPQVPLRPTGYAIMVEEIPAGTPVPMALYV